MRAFPVRLPSGARYWTVIDEDLAVVGEADEFLRQVRFGRDGSELTTRAYAGAIALYLRWCGRVTAGLGDLAAAERAEIDEAVAVVRRHRTVMLGMPRTPPPSRLPGLPHRSAAD